METGTIPVGCVVMAAGSALRFGENKLLAAFGGGTLIERALDAVPADLLEAVAVVTGYPAVAALARRYGFMCIENDRPELGVSRTIRLGTEALRERCGAILFMTADQPLLRRESVAALAAAVRAHPDAVAALGYNGIRGSPCAFPRALYDELCALEGDTGGRAVIRRHPDRLLVVETDPRELRDADTPEALAALMHHA